MGKVNIIETELPPIMHKAATDAISGGGMQFTKITNEFAEAQRAAILRFCEAVEKEAKENCPFTPPCASCFGNAMKKLRDQILGSQT